jgi:hypothetical protein
VDTIYNVSERARWLLLDPTGRRVLLALYSVAALTSVVVYATVKTPAYAAGQAALLAFAPVWITWCVRRPW